ncbi:hypothetical protein EIN_321660 [Entamoeba invadens IP1]|uniref:Leucine rich repeat containing protein BspA family protein n=1 Tax=Entamoeba invadens IP1 TaxID=370355 RepID=A0A0A1UCV6_ENTIV|nr:hypothetical protein EIN_321660 [Entamoeba invadens IP1]ELP93743.1 hypothetical protein EIN_321660 [Entamoeba invadens IP1]|eukprot:XP_004260514.1 hypothetical protein EIN_321660 [Entamoeba invadens IP1]
MSQLDVYHMMVVSQYFSTINNLIVLEMVCKKFQGNMDKFHNNPVPINKKTIKFFPKIETLNLWNCDNEVFGNDLFNRKKTRNNNQNRLLPNQCLVCSDLRLYSNPLTFKYLI